MLDAWFLSVSRCREGRTVRGCVAARQLCIDFVASGRCQAGGACRFAHSMEEVRALSNERPPTAVERVCVCVCAWMREGEGTRERGRRAR